ncbi:hypothetical protein D3C80_1453050 [compost metagenome]
MQGVGDIFGRLDDFLLLDEPEHLGGSLGARCHHEVIGQAIDDPLLPGLGNIVGGRDQGDGTGGGGGAQPGANLPLGIRLEQVAIHVAGPAAHHVARHDVLGHGGFHEAGGRVNLHLAGLDVRFVHHPAHTAVVIDVAMGVDHRDHRLLAALLEVKLHPHFGRLG